MRSFLSQLLNVDIFKQVTDSVSPFYRSLLRQGALFYFSIAQLCASDSYPQHLKPNYRAGRSTGRIREALFRSMTSPTGAVDTLRVVAIRIEFKADTVNTTVGNGRFDLSTPSTPGLDPPPHNRDYFAAQLTALANYYSIASGGRLLIQAEVFPSANNSAYQLAKDMSYYSPGKNSPVADQRLSELFRDALLVADQAGGIDFANFDSFIIFHAGVGNDFSIEFDTTPNDVPSAFLTLEDLRTTLGNNDPSYQGIAVEGGAFYIPEGMILPETQNQEGVEFGLLGTIALMFGHQIGLPNLFNTDSGSPGVGRWGLMDQGSGNFQGLLPALPSAWERVFLGWEQPVTIASGENLEVAALLAGGQPKVYKIPITDDEYFLVENRQTDVHPDGVAIGYDANGTRIEFKFDNAGNPQLLSSAPIGVITRVDEYDFGLPGSGILIWHIDEKVIRENYATNRVNADRDRRGVDLEEADGAQDIGRVYGFLDPGAGAENGVPEDAWWKSNPVITQFLRPGEPVTFGPTTQPSSAGTSGAYTGIVITNFSEQRPVMTFSVRNAFALAGFPQYAGGSAGTFSPLLADLTGDGRIDIVVATSIGEIFAWQFDGRKVIDNLDSVSVEQPNGLIVRVSAARFAVVGDSLCNAPALADLNGDGRSEVLATGTDGVLRVWQAADQNLDGRADLLWQANLGAPSRANVAIRADSGVILCGAQNGKLFGFAPDGAQLWETQLEAPVRGISLYNQSLFVVTVSTGYSFFQNNGSGITCITQTASNQLENRFGIDTPSGAPENLFDAATVADLHNDGSNEVIVRDGRGRLFALSICSDRLQGFPVTLPGLEKAGIAVADVNNDGRKEIVLVSTSRLLAYNFNGVFSANFPLQISATLEAKAEYPLVPIIADADGDGSQDVLVPGVDGNVYAYGSNGRLVSGFPLAMSGPGLGSLATADLDGDGHLELVAVSGNGYVHVWRLPQSSTDAAWPMHHHDAAQTSLNPRRETPVVRTDGLMPSSLVYNYPNPTEGQSTTIRYRLNEEARVKISIYDTAGDLVQELSGPGVAQAENEVTWNLRQVESGVYLARVEAQGSRETQVAVIKIAVIK